MDWKAVRDELARARHAAGLTLDQLAARTGIDRSTIHRIENTKKRKSHNPDLETIELLVTAMGIPLSAFFTRIEAAHLNAQGHADNTAATPPHSSAVDHDRALSVEALADLERDVGRAIVRAMRVAQAGEQAADSRPARPLARTGTRKNR